MLAKEKKERGGKKGEGKGLKLPYKFTNLN
jgi:hypothetical protein